MQYRLHTGMIFLAGCLMGPGLACSGTGAGDSGGAALGEKVATGPGRTKVGAGGSQQAVSGAGGGGTGGSSADAGTGGADLGTGGSVTRLRVGDPGVSFQETSFDPDYPQMERWTKAGVRGGIPFIDELIIEETISGTDSAGIEAAIKAVANRGGGAILLKDGDYQIDSQVDMKSDVYLVGESRDGVRCSITMDSGNAFYFGEGVENSGLYRLSIEGSWGTPKYDWNFGLGTEAQEELKNNSNVSVKFKGASDSFLDDIAIQNSAMHPVWVNAKHITLRDLHIDGVFNKGGGAQGYLMVLDSDNLVTSSYVTHLRHFSLQGESSEYNVVYGNDIEQEISFHSGDGGNNLLENNVITLPADMWDGYYAIMGPWSVQHVLSLEPNFLYANTCTQHNQEEAPLSPWSGNESVFSGPHEVKPLTHEGKINNFTEHAPGLPSGKTLYPIVLSAR